MLERRFPLRMLPEDDGASLGREDDARGSRLAQALRILAGEVGVVEALAVLHRADAEAPAGERGDHAAEERRLPGPRIPDDRDHRGRHGAGFYRRVECDAHAMPPTEEKARHRSARNIPLLFLYQTFAYGYAYVPVSYFFFEKRGYALAGFASLTSIYYGSVVLAQLPTGLLADRLGRRLVLVLGPLAQAFGALAIALSHSFAGFALGQALLGVGQALLASAGSAALFDSLRDLGRETDYLRVEAIATVFRLLGTSLAFAAGGLIGALFGVEAPYLATAVFVFVAALAALFLREPESAKAGRAARTGAILGASLRSLAREAPVRWIAVYYASLFVWLRLAFYTYQPKLREVGHEDFARIGALFALLNVAAAIVSRGAARIVGRLGEGATLFSMQGALLATFVFLGLSRSPLAFLAFFVQQAPFGLHFPVVFNATNRLVPSERRATVLSLQSLLGRLAFAAYFPAFGWLAERSGLERAYLVSAGLGAGVLGVLALLRHRPPSEGSSCPAGIGRLPPLA